MSLYDNKHLSKADEVSFYDYWSIVLKRKKLIFGVFVLFVSVTTIVNFLMPKVYRGEAILRVVATGITAKDIIDIIGTLGDGRIQTIFAKNSGSIRSLRILEVQSSPGKLNIRIESTEGEKIQDSIAELVEYINNIPLVKQGIKAERERVETEMEIRRKQIRNLTALIDEYRKFIGTYEKKIKDGDITRIYFIPTELKYRISEMEEKKYGIETAMKNLKGVTGIELAGKPYISKTPVSPKIKQNIFVSGIIGLFSGIFLAFFLEYIKKLRYGEAA